MQIRKITDNQGGFYGRMTKWQTEFEQGLGIWDLGLGEKWRVENGDLRMNKDTNYTKKNNKIWEEFGTRISGRKQPQIHRLKGRN